MKPVEKIITTILIILIVLIFTWPLILAEMLNVGAGRQPSISVLVDSIADTIKNGNNYDKYAKDYMKSKFGEVVLSKMNILIGERVESHKYAYRVRFDDILSKNFVVYVSSNGGCTDTFSSTLTTDVKFQHLYSEWVKKQVGIEDENVELKFAGNYDPPYIEFNKITSLSEDYREVFENTHNLYCNRCYVSNIKDLNETNSRIIANDIREKCLFKVIKITKIPNEKISGNIHLSTGAFEKNNDKNFKYRFDLHNFSSELIES